MYRSGISSVSIKTLEPDEDSHPSSRSRHGQATRRQRAEEAVPWRTLALALAGDEKLSAPSSAHSAAVVATAKAPKSRPSTAGSLLASSSLKPASGNRHIYRDWLLREGLAVAGDERCKTMKFSSEYYETLSRLIELQTKVLPLTGDQISACIKLIWAHAPAVSRCLLAALHMETARQSSDCTPSYLSRESCVEVVACCLKWLQYVRSTDSRAPVAQLRRALLAVCDSIFLELQPEVWRVEQPLRTLSHLKLIDIEHPSPDRPDNRVDCASTGSECGPSFIESRHESRSLAPDVFASAACGVAGAAGGSYVFRKDKLVKKKLSKDSVPLWLEQCSDEHLLEAAMRCPTYFEVCQQFAKQEQHDREKCAKTISNIRALQEKTAVLCREEDAAVRHAFAMDWDRSNLFRNVNSLRDDLDGKQAEFDASLDEMIRKQNELLKQVQEAKQRFQRLRSLQEHSRSLTPEELSVVRGQFFKRVISSCAALSSALPVLSEVILTALSIVDQRPDFHTEEFLSQFPDDKPETVMDLPPREFLRRWAAWLAVKAGWRGDMLRLRVPHDLKFGDFYSWLHAAIKVLSSNDLSAPYLPKGECLKLGSSLVFVGEKIMKDWAKKKAVILSARLAAGDLEAALLNEGRKDGSGSSQSSSGSSAEWSSSGSGSEGSYDNSDECSQDGDSDVFSSVSRGSKSSARSRFSEPVSLEEGDSGSEDSGGSDSSGASSSDDDYSSKAGSARSFSSSKAKVEFSIGTRIKQQNQVRRVLGDESALAEDLAQMEEESRQNMIRERKQAAKQKRAEKLEKKKGKRGKKGSKKESKDQRSTVSFKDDAGSSPKESAKPKKKKKKHRRKRRQRLKVNLMETDEQKELRRLLMVRDAVIKFNRPLREGPERIYRTLRMAAMAIIAGVKSYRATMGFFFKYKPPPELEDQTPKERMAKVVQLFRQYLPAGFLVDFDLDCGAPEPHYALLGALFVAHPCMHAIKPDKTKRGGFRKRNEQMSNALPKERLQMAQVTLTGLQLVLQELVSAQPPNLIQDLSDEEIDFQIRSWLHRCTSAWAQISAITCSLKEIAQKEQKRLAMWEQLQGRVQNMRAEFNMQRTHAALVEVKRLKNLEKEGAAQQKKKELAEAIEFQKEAAKSKEGRRALAKLTHVTVARFEDIFSESDQVDFDDADAGDDEETQEQIATNRERKLKDKSLAKQVEINLCRNIFLQRFVTLERVFAYYCRCIKNEPERFKFRESMGPKEYAIFCQECEITGEAKGKLSIIDSRRVFKRANMEGDEGDVTGDTDLEFEEFCDLLVRLGWAVYGPRGAAAQSILPQRLTLSEALVELLDHHSVLRLALQEDRLIFLNLVEDAEVQEVLQEHEQALLKVWKSNQARRRSAEAEELKGLNAVQWANLLEDTGALANHLSREMTTSIFEMVQDTGEVDGNSDDGGSSDDEEDAMLAADNAKLDFDEFKVGLCAAAMCKYPDPHEHLADKIEKLICFHVARN